MHSTSSHKKIDQVCSIRSTTIVYWIVQRSAICLPTSSRIFQPPEKTVWTQHIACILVFRWGSTSLNRVQSIGKLEDAQPPKNSLYSRRGSKLSFNLGIAESHIVLLYSKKNIIRLNLREFENTHLHFYSCVWFSDIFNGSFPAS